LKPAEIGAPSIGRHASNDQPRHRCFFNSSTNVARRGKCCLLRLKEIPMPLRINAGLTKKIGLPNYGSLGVSCHIECDLDASLSQPDCPSLMQQLRRAYQACALAVHDELNRQRAIELPAAADRPVGTARESHSERSDDHARRLDAAPQASQRQLVYARQLATRIPGLSAERLDSLAQRMTGQSLEALSAPAASRLIDTLKALRRGELELKSLFNGAAT
jgi:hypothetical protein